MLKSQISGNIQYCLASLHFTQKMTQNALEMQVLMILTAALENFNALWSALKALRCNEVAQ